MILIFLSLDLRISGLVSGIAVETTTKSQISGTLSSWWPIFIWAPIWVSRSTYFELDKSEPLTFVPV